MMAIVIIIQTPRCPPKETLDQVQKSAILQYDVNHPMDIDGNGQENGDGKSVLKALGSP